MIHLARPCRGHVTQWYENTQPDGNPHTGNDYAYTDGINVFPEIFAAADGEVVFVGDSRTLGWPNAWYFNPDFDRSDSWDSSAGNVIVLRHKQNGILFDTTYSHVESWTVREGQTVQAGQRIGTIGNTGNSYGKHLHFELLFHPFNFGTATYGRSNPNPYIGTLAAASAPTEEDTLSAAEKDAIIKAVQADGAKTRKYIKDLAYSGWLDEKGKKHPGFMLVIEEEQRRAAKDRTTLPAAIAAAVWATPVKRAGGNVSALQELADAKSKLLGLEPALARIEDNTDPAALADLIPDALAQQVIDKLAERLNGTK